MRRSRRLEPAADEENCKYKKLPPVIGVIGGVFDRMRGERQGLSGGGRPAGRPGFVGAGAASGRPYGHAEHGRPCGPNLRLLQAGYPADLAKRACQSRDSMLYFQKMPIPKKGAAEMMKLRNDHNRIPVQQLSL